MSNLEARMRAAGREHKRLRSENVALVAENVNLADELARLVPLPVPGEDWDYRKNYTVGDTVTVDGVEYECIHTNRNNGPEQTLGIEWKIKEAAPVVLVWADIESNTAIAVGDLVEHNKLTWRCIKAHAKSQVRVPLDGSQWWEVA